MIFIRKLVNFKSLRLGVEIRIKGSENLKRLLIDFFPEKLTNLRQQIVMTLKDLKRFLLEKSLLI